jgi:uncharacterized membrane protein YfcA
VIAKLLAAGLTAFAASGLTLFSGFGLGTILLPVFALFFPVEVAVAATAVVHALNNLFKLGLLAKHAVPRLIVVFGIPAVLGAFPGAILLTRLASGAPLWVWRAGPRECVVTPIGLVMGVLILVFAAVELVPTLHRFRAGPKWLPLGGLLAGFFGGLSGHQGALRAAFLSPLGLRPESFVATQATLAILVDVSRLLVYGHAFLTEPVGGLSTRDPWTIVATSTACAFAGAWYGTRLLPKVTVRFVRKVTGALLLVVGTGLAAGLV